MKAKEMKRQIEEWLSIFKFGYGGENIWTKVEDTDERSFLRLSLFTDVNEYVITAIWRHNCNHNGYLFCGSSSRKPRAGEDWRRGNDLADGSFNHSTWVKILSDIVSYECVKVHPRKPKFDTIGN